MPTSARPQLSCHGFYVSDGPEVHEQQAGLPCHKLTGIDPYLMRRERDGTAVDVVLRMRMLSIRRENSIAVTTPVYLYFPSQGQRFVLDGTPLSAA